MKYTSAAAFRQALEERLKNETTSTGLGLPRLRKRVALELFLHRLLLVTPNRRVLKDALALNFRLAIATRSTKDIDLGRDDDEQAAITDITAAVAALLAGSNVMRVPGCVACLYRIQGPRRYRSLGTRL